MNEEMRKKLAISIHALLAESDGIGAAAGALTGISIHALLAESDVSTGTPRAAL